jgi:hypothetical protein
MPLSPAPLFPGASPLPPTGKQPPDRRALRVGALLAILTLIVALVLGQLLLVRIEFLTPGLQAQALGGSNGGGGAATFQGFTMAWTRRQTGGGYSTPASLKNMQSQAGLFHMNAVLIPVVADMPDRSDSKILWHSSDSGNMDTLSDNDYVKAIQDARKAGLVPILELELRQFNTLQPVTDSSLYIGKYWSGLRSDKTLTSHRIGAVETAWFDNYTAFAAHYAQMSAQYHLPYFIFGDQLTNLTYDTDSTNAKNDPRGIVRVAGDPQFSCGGRRECAWRHLINALRNQSYATLAGNKSQTGGGYSGKLIYGAYWDAAPEGGAQNPEFESIAWWDAVDYIGVDAYFPLTQNQAIPPLGTLEDSWHGKGNELGLSNSKKDIYARLEKVSDNYHGKPIIFTGAGYQSAPGANSAQGVTNTAPENAEQLNDMQALLMTFTGSPFWAGVFWYADEPISPRHSQPNWDTGTNWAGDTLNDSKDAGKWLATYYHNNPIRCSC